MTGPSTPSRPTAVEPTRGLTTPHAALLLGMIGHEVRNLMTPIVARAQKAQRSLDDPEITARDLERIARNATRAIEVTTALLHAGKAAHDRRSGWRPESCPVHRAASAAIEAVGAELAARGVVAAPPAGQDIIAPLPEALLRSVLVNLLLNAAQATPPGGRVELRTVAGARCSTWNAEVVGVEVIDSGVGMSPAQVATVIQAFTQGGHTAMVEQMELGRAPAPSRSGSIGLGLAICRWLVEETGGRLEIDSSPMHGTTVRCLWRAATPTPTNE